MYLYTEHRNAKIWYAGCHYAECSVVNTAGTEAIYNVPDDNETPAPAKPKVATTLKGKDNSTSKGNSSNR